MRASRAFSAIIAASVAEAGDAVSPPQLRALVLIATWPEVNAVTIASALGLHPSSATRLCDRLVESGLVERAESPSDRRRVVLTLTDDGVALVGSVMGHRRAALVDILGRMSASDVEMLTAALTAFTDAAEEPHEGVSVAPW
ncbi:MarR family winged helix-turn-helix transcriptional regulator [Phycicoccus duodecadis]|uniref:DNA-binding MarR family transcriptional regulator n=1 Tax=Phycicoccus duodecadis TaxID=173053 RepID=A0A2N3YLP1_9MICO|nr:MarR family transcriptional regulator [Phycicoccus duodecadis]PKW27775.1 DNA-binding MarR family transcriptional regulator [Phycicoccus duodecadis]